MSNLTIEKAIKEIEKIASKNQSRVPEIKVHHAKLNVGECYRQGDLYIFRVASSHPRGEEVKRRQLADGQSIGQRHVLVDGEFKIYKGTTAPVKSTLVHERAGCIGYAFEVLSKTCRNSHPEHDHFILEKGHYQVWHQVDLQTLRKVTD